MSTDRRSFDVGTSQQVQGDLAGIIARLEAVISQRSADVSAAMADFQADGVSEEYRTVEDRWNRAASEVRTIIELVKTTMVKNDDTATTTLAKARTAVQSIG
ncbi:MULTISPECIES: pore-forming ESAT-6 family protein [unclassified Micromonospora]|uniref:pore-forming ESAT-6 family protein n=1 Tax=unclassified Micromonospora TaxID=2617518 RepID=UPI00249CF318|nr:MULTISPECIES: pore-forming ESAT-6 family protein [unclassified Micromonospora]WFE51258.1 pore-forming ESAT-6 family protein [Micromonospora sp. WMMD1155]WFF02011.1 pore-forming ESAT-6 family protein [Micromonospora sp. WMMD964]